MTWGYMPRMPRARNRIENSGKYGRMRRDRGRDAKYSPIGMFNRVPWVAVRATLVSMGYRVVGSGPNSPSGKWNSKRAEDWVAVTVEKNGIYRTRWVRQMPGMPIRVSDGSDVPRHIVMKYALLKRAGINKVKERADQWREANTQRR